MMGKIKNFLRDQWIIVIILVILAIFLIFDIGGGGSDYEEEGGSIWPGLIVLAVFVIGIYIYEKFQYLSKLEDIIRYLNDKYKLYRKRETYTPWGSIYDDSLKPRNKDEQESWPYSVEFQSNYGKAVFNSRKRLKRRLEELDIKVAKYEQWKVEKIIREK